MAPETRKTTSFLNPVTTDVFDCLGRAKQSQLTSDAEGTVYTGATYDVLGLTATASNPHLSAGLPTDAIATYTYDGNNFRVKRTAGSTTTYRLADHLSARVFTDSGGAVIGQRGFPAGRAVPSLHGRASLLLLRSLYDVSVMIGVIQR